MKLYGFCPDTGHNRRAIMERCSGIDGAFRTKHDGSPIELTGIAISAVRDDGMLLSNQVERNAF